MSKVVYTPNAPEAIGPYSQAVKCGNMLFTSGQIAINPATGNVEAATIEEQTEQSLKNVGHILKEAGYDYTDVVKTTVLLADIKDFAAMNAVYAKFFSGAFPARVCYQVAALPMGAKVEIDAIAVK